MQYITLSDSQLSAACVRADLITSTSTSAFASVLIVIKIDRERDLCHFKWAFIAATSKCRFDGTRDERKQWFAQTVIWNLNERIQNKKFKKGSIAIQKIVTKDLSGKLVEQSFRHRMGNLMLLT